MHNLERKMIDSGCIDAEITSIKIDDWFENLYITYMVNNNLNNAKCTFENCLKISLTHDNDYGKGKNKNGNLNYKYFIQEIKIFEEAKLFYVDINAWPLSAKIICKEIEMTTVR